MEKVSVPDKDRPEWRMMISGEIQHSYKNYVLQTKIHQLRKEIEQGRIDVVKAIDDLYSLCSKYALAVQRDFKQIFITW